MLITYAIVALTTDYKVNGIVRSTFICAVSYNLEIST